MKWEISAPAGNLEHLKTALELGAQALYAGPRGLSGRPPMAEMSFAQLEKARELTSGAGVKLYLAVNANCPWGKEAETRSRLRSLLELKPDALIIGDAGILKLVKEFPAPPPLHASTFLGIYNAAGAAWALKQGFSRLVMNTGLTLPETAAITQAVPGLVYEAIAWGGICFNDNHRCNLPHGLRSRREARQTGKFQPEKFSREAAFCQLRTELWEKGRILNSGRLLLGKMLDLSHHLPELIASGITCFKIAGRERETAFVAKAVQALKRGLAELELSR